ncbi:hypothetical protein [Mesorhizobium sp. M0522]|uniref:hypothetical protein n=1 Tax=Mesorhizobium sp. M0522 TaxID=2956958 RepID=UPI00333998B8
MTISAEMARLVAIECLAPTAAILAGRGFPTLAGGNFFDSRRISVGELSIERFTPAVSIYTRKAESPRRGLGQGSVERFARTALEIVAELAIGASDESGDFTDALAEDDVTARLTLAALCGQIVQTLTASPAGALFRKAVIAIDGIDFEPHAIPQLNLRWQRTTMLFDCQIPGDDFTVGGQLPEPSATLAALLPAGSYAAGILADLSSRFAASPTYPAIQTIAFEVKRNGVSGEMGTTAAVAPPFADIED